MRSLEPIEKPSSDHWLGTDALARDTFSRLVHGAWVSLVVAVVAAACGVIIGGFLGSLVGYVRGKTETTIMSLVDVILAFPALILLLALVSIFCIWMAAPRGVRLAAGVAVSRARRGS